MVQTGIDSFYITWIVPKKTNGQLKSFTIYRKQTDHQSDEDETTHPNNLYTFTVPKHVNYHRTSQLNPGSTYEFWVTAQNNIGESAPSTRVRRTLNKNCPAEIINFNTIYNVYVGENLEIPCKTAGQPQAESEWLFNGNSLRSQTQDKSNLIHEHYSPNEQIFSSFLHLTNIQSIDQGNYTCHSFNIHGHSYVTYQVNVRDPDTLDQLENDDDLDVETGDSNRALIDQNNQMTNSFTNSTFSTITSPLIRLIKSNHDHIIIQWKVRNPFLLNSILAFETFYRPVQNDQTVTSGNSIDSNIEWKQFRLRNTLLDEQQPQTIQSTNLIVAKQSSKNKLKRNRQITINGLNCGTNYQIYMILDTVFGKSTPSNILNTRTLGREPIAANVGLFFSRLNSSTVKLNLDKWNDGGCSVFEYKVKWKQISMTRNSSQISKKSSSTGYNLIKNDLPISNSQWNSINNNIWHSQQPVYLTNLDPNNHYKVRVDMRNAAGLTSMDYDLRVNAVPLIKPQSENTFRILSSSSSSYSNELEGSNQDGKNIDLIVRSSTIGSSNEQDGQINNQIFLIMFIILLFVIVIAVFAFFHRTMQQKLSYARSNRMLQLSSDANSILSGPTNGSAINASDSVSNACLGLGKQHLNKLHQLNMDYANTCPSNLTAELTNLSVLRNNQPNLDSTYAKCLLKQHQQAATTNTIAQHTTSLQNIEADNFYQSLTLARTNTDNLLSTFSKKINGQQVNPQEIYSVINKNRQQQAEQNKTLKQLNQQSTFSKQAYEIVEHNNLEQQRYSIPNIKQATLNLTNQLHGQITEQDIQKLEEYQRLFESNYVTGTEQDLHNQFNLTDDTSIKTMNKNIPKMFNNSNNNYEMNNDCNCCTMPLETDCCTMNTLNAKHHWLTNNCDFSY